ncbi:OPT/YSL family transporter [Brachybacterium sp. MASK1Z-5]|uniref:OPT/YSL family transporter n=1 Tax=Brachybacterium halotolerans TaxID=2795215 RepID=A0ABS1BC36_9MICO|nr:OPT/YSL family transporter [Brachybacterium halotolerans]
MSSSPAASVSERAAAQHPRAFEPVTALITLAVSLLGAAIGIHMITTLGVSPNTSVIGAVIAMLIGRVGFAGLHRMRDVNRQNLVQSSISGATFAAANSLLTPIAIPYLFGRPELVWPMLLGASLGLAIDVYVLYRAYGSRFFPASAAWPPGVAAAETIKAGDQGGKQAVVLISGGVVGFVASLLGLPMSAAGIAMIGNMWALLMFAAGLLIAQYIPGLLDVDLAALYVPHGVMVGAGVVALVQIVLIMAGKQTARQAARARELEEAAQEDPALAPTVTDAMLRKALTSGFGLFFLGAVLLALVGGMWTQLPWWGLIGFALFAAFAAIVHELIVGLAAMHAGWFPAFAVTLIFLILGLLLHFPAVPLALLIGYCASTGPAFADMGYDFKAGWILRRDRRPYTAFELEGRREQLKASVLGFVMAIGLVALVWPSLFADGNVPPTSQVYADTISAGLSDPSVLVNLLIWAIPGAIVQIIGGPGRQMGILLATGLLVATPNAGWLVLIALLARVLWQRWRGATGEQEVALVGAGLIAGDSVHSVGTMIWKH